MKAITTVYHSVLYLLRIQIGATADRLNPNPREPTMLYVFLPLAGLVVGLVSGLAASFLAAMQMRYIPALAGLAIMAVLGGKRQTAAALSIRRKDFALNAGSMLFVVLAVVFLVLGLDALQAMRGADFITLALLFLPAIGSLAMVSAASVMPEAPNQLPLSSVKGLHLILAAGLTLALLMPAFGVSALAYMGVGVLAGSLTALIGGRKEYRVDLLYAAAAFAQLIFLFVLLVANNTVIHY